MSWLGAKTPVKEIQEVQFIKLTLQEIFALIMWLELRHLENHVEPQEQQQFTPEFRLFWIGLKVLYGVAKNKTKVKLNINRVNIKNITIIFCQ